MRFIFHEMNPFGTRPPTRPTPGGFLFLTPTMSLRDQPYFPLYVQDFLTDEKLMECSAEATGVYIRIMCILHKSDPYGKFLLKQNNKQSGNQILDFAKKFARFLPFELPVILAGLQELLEHKCLHIEGDFLIQKRMVEDGELSLKRSISGKKGGDKRVENSKNFAQPKSQATPEYEYENNNSNTVNTFGEKQLEEMIIQEMLQIWKKYNPNYQAVVEDDYPALLQLAYKIAKAKGWKKDEVVNGKLKSTLESWERIVQFIKRDSFYRKLELTTLDKKWAGLYQSMTAESESDDQKDPAKVKIKLK